MIKIKQNGQKHSISVETMQMLDSKGSNPPAQDKHQQTNKQPINSTPPPVADKDNPFGDEIEKEV